MYKHSIYQLEDFLSFLKSNNAFAIIIIRRLFWGVNPFSLPHTV